MERREEQIRDGIRKYGLKGKSTGADQALRACKRGSNWIVGRGGGSGRSSELEPRRGWEGVSRKKMDKKRRNDKKKRGRRRSIETRLNRIQGGGSVSKVRGWLVGDKEVDAVDNAADSRVESLNIGTETSRGTVQCALPFIYRARAAFHGTFKRHTHERKSEARRWRMCVCVSVLAYIRSWCFLPVELFTCPSPAPPELCARACFFYRLPISVSVTHFTSTPPRPANTSEGMLKRHTSGLLI